MLKKLRAAVFGLLAAALGVPAFAAIDVTAVTTGITDAGTAMTTIITALMALAVSLFGITMVYRYIKGRH